MVSVFNKAQVSANRYRSLIIAPPFVCGYKWTNRIDTMQTCGHLLLTTHDSVLPGHYHAALRHYRDRRVTSMHWRELCENCVPASLARPDSGLWCSPRNKLSIEHHQSFKHLIKDTRVATYRYNSLQYQNEPLRHLGTVSLSVCSLPRR